MFNKTINLTYNDYINYLKIKFSDFQVSQILPEDMPLYQKIKSRLENASALPQHILDASLLDSVDLDTETLQAVAEIKATIAPTNKFNIFLENLVIKINQFYITSLKNLDLIGISTLLLLVTVLSLLLTVGLVTGESGILVGAAGGSGNESSEMVLNPTLFTFVGLITSILAMVLLFIEKNKRK